MKMVARWAQVAASEVRICQVRAPVFGFVTTGDFARDHRGAQLAFGAAAGGGKAGARGSALREWREVFPLPRRRVYRFYLSMRPFRLHAYRHAP
jgi:hypothetical protein